MASLPDLARDNSATASWGTAKGFSDAALVRAAASISILGERLNG